MADSDAPVGDCPDCGREIPAAYQLIEYQRADGTTGIYAECPECDKVVSPR
jgi:endogenous inhibitor of DNA gyrase (YacG/DUF329 family)